MPPEARSTRTPHRPRRFPHLPTGYATTVLGDSPTAYWRLGDATTTTTARDQVGASPGANPGTYLNGVVRGSPSLLPASTADSAATFDGVNDYVRVANSAALNPSGAITLEAWIKPSSIPAAGSFKGIVTKPESYALQFNGPRLEFTVIQAGVRRRLQAPVGTIVAGQTYFVAGTYNGTTQRLYVNFAQVASQPLTGAIGPQTQVLSIGSWAASEYFSGSIDEVAVYSTALSAARLSAHYDAGRGASSGIGAGGADLADRNACVEHERVPLVGRQCDGRDGLHSRKGYDLWVRRTYGDFAGGERHVVLRHRPHPRHSVLLSNPGNELCRQLAKLGDRHGHHPGGVWPSGSHRAGCLAAIQLVDRPHLDRQRCRRDFLCRRARPHGGILGPGRCDVGGQRVELHRHAADSVHDLLLSSQGRDEWRLIVLLEYGERDDLRWRRNASDRLRRTWLPQRSRASRSTCRGRIRRRRRQASRSSAT